MKRIVASVIALPLLFIGVPAHAGSVMYPYSSHVQNIGWQDTVGDGDAAGTTGKSLRLEAVRFTFPGQEARGHVQNIGWQSWQANDSTQVGTVGKGLRLEAIQVHGTAGSKIECQAHVQGIGWMPRVGDGKVCGTTGKGLRLEAVRFWLIPA